MELQTSRFGRIDVAAEAVITFTQPIIGFKEQRRYTLLPGPEGQDALLWLQSTESGELAFLLLDPSRLIPEYTVRLREQELAELAVSSPEELEVYTLVVVPDDPAQIRTNLRAPVLINRRQGLGKQTILDRGDYPVRYYLAQTQQRSQAPKEATNARADT